MRRILLKTLYPFLILICLLASCSKRVYQVDEIEPVLFPSPPDTARIQFLKRYGGSTDFTGKQSKFKTFVAGEEEQISISKPYGVTIYDGRLFIVDAGIAGLHIFDFEEESYEIFSPAGRGKLKMPINCFIDESGNLYVTDVVRKQLIIFNQNLEYIDEIGGDETFRPTDVFVTGDTILVTDPKNNRINFYDKHTLNHLYSLPDGAEVGDENWLYNPLNICVSHGKLYITDFGSSRIKVFSLKGEFLNSCGSYGRGLGQFVRPKGIAVDREQILYVIDAGFQNIQMFNSENQLLMFFGGPYNGPGDMYLPANVTIDYDHVDYYQKYVDPVFDLKYLIFVTNQYGPDKLSVYGRVEPK